MGQIILALPLVVAAQLQIISTTFSKRLECCWLNILKIFQKSNLHARMSPLNFAQPITEDLLVLNFTQFCGFEDNL